MRSAGEKKQSQTERRAPLQKQAGQFGIGGLLTAHVARTGAHTEELTEVSDLAREKRDRERYSERV